jgi:RNA polymerase sigma factor (TIGR02999 family)
MSSEPITDLLARWKSGDRATEAQLMEAIYPTLRGLANARVQRHSGALTLRATELANEAFTLLHQQRAVDWESRGHFFAIAATVIRRVAIDYLRSRNRDKRGGGVPFVDIDALTDAEMPTIDESVDWIAIDQALTEFEAFDPACAKVVELKFFSGLTTEEIAAVSGSSVATVGRQWRFARAWLGDRLGAG